MKRIALVLTALITLTMLSEVQAQKTKVKMKTTLGDITLVLYDDTPGHRDNFIKLANSKFYEGLLFHRVIPGFMIQGGDPATRALKPGDQLPTIPAELKANRYHKKGALCAARTDNPQKASSGSQFYIVVGKVWTTTELEQIEMSGKHPKFTPDQIKTYTTVGGYPYLDTLYTVYGEVTQGLDIVDKIAAVPTGPGDKPVTPVTMKLEIVK